MFIKLIRSMCRVLLVLSLSLFLVADLKAEKSIRDLESTVILISIDGLRYDYIDKFRPPALSKLANNGVRAKWMIPSFPTKTFPNHYTVATGLYPEHHGIIENNIFDFGTVFRLSIREEVQKGRWWLGEPIWVTAEKQGVRAAAFFFPGTEAEIAGKRPTFWKEYDGDVPNNNRVDQILKWIDLPRSERPRMYTLYFSDVDDAGHDYGPDSAETRKSVLKVDASIKRLIEGLETRKIDKKVNVIITSDHGMAAVDQRNAVVMDDFLDQELTERVLTTGEIWQIFPKSGETENIMKSLAGIQRAKCWRKAEIPDRLHYKNSPRIAPIVCSSDEGWSMTTREAFEKKKKREDFLRTRGAHGYDNALQSMQATFIAHGRAFKKKKVVEPFENIHVYELMCKVLGLTPAKNDGNLSKVSDMLR